jgi:hypothetical protein
MLRYVPNPRGSTITNKKEAGFYRCLVLQSGAGNAKGKDTRRVRGWLGVVD